jgi:hypothetical protein
MQHDLKAFFDELASISVNDGSTDRAKRTGRGSLFLRLRWLRREGGKCK